MPAVRLAQVERSALRMSPRACIHDIGTQTTGLCAANEQAAGSARHLSSTLASSFAPKAGSARGMPLAGAARLLGRALAPAFGLAHSGFLSSRPGHWQQRASADAVCLPWCPRCLCGDLQSRPLAGFLWLSGPRATRAPPGPLVAGQPAQLSAAHTAAAAKRMHPSIPWLSPFSIDQQSRSQVASSHIASM